ncbi:MAG: DUF1365 domain-containing protein [Gammaproteobacteria bacterium]|nr:DUF1365 domain-containing protein [Gammaproteobacteria bacterium]
MNSKIYVGQVSHKRFQPHEHVFNYRMFMMYLDLDELPLLFDKFLFWSARGFNLAYFNRNRHLGNPDQPLKQSVIDLVYKQQSIQLTGPIRLLTNLSYFGYGFNPVSFYYCYDSKGETVKVVVVEVNNTPWGEQFCYVLPVDRSLADGNKYIHHLSKQFHVSPFNPMQQKYEWHISDPGDRLLVYMQNFSDEQKVFQASLSLHRQNITRRTLAKVLMAFPFMTGKIILAIYYEAFRLWLKYTPVYDHPVVNTTASSKK